MFIGDHILLLAGAGRFNAADSLLQSLIKIYLLLADDGAALKQRSITGWRYHRSHVGWRLQHVPAEMLSYIMFHHTDDSDY